MILKQGFHMHPKTVMLRTRGGSSAVEALQQLWLFAEQARAWEFPNWTKEFVAAIGSLYGKPDFADILLAVGFLDLMDGGGFALHDFAEHNAKLTTCWANAPFGKLGAKHGSKGGRPRNPRKTPYGGFDKPPMGGSKNPPYSTEQNRTEQEGKNTERVFDAPLDPWEVRPGFLIPESLRTEECRKAVNDWLAYKKESRQGYKETGLRVALKQWGETFTSATFPEAVAASISAGYRGIFPPNRNGKPAPRRPEDKQIQENIPIPMLSI